MKRLTKAEKFNNACRALERKGYLIEEQHGEYYAVMRNSSGDTKIVGKKAKN